MATIKNMHYDFKQKLNKLDSNVYVDLKIPEIDRILNRALNLYILLVAKPRVQNLILGFEKIQRTIDDISPLIANNIPLSVTHSVSYSIAQLPVKYAYYLSTEELIANKGSMSKKLKVKVIKHNDEHARDYFYDSDFDWGTCNIRFSKDGIKLFTGGEFNITLFAINYIMTHPYIHNAEDFALGSYKLPDGTTLTGHEDCILPEITHDEIVDLAVLLATNNLQLVNEYQANKDVLGIKQLLSK